MRGGEPGSEDQGCDLRGREIVGQVGVDEPGVDGALQHLRQIDARAVVGDVDHDRVLLAPRLDDESTDLALARRTPLFAALDAVIDRVAHQVQERLGEAIENRAVELELDAHELHLHPLAGPLGDLAGNARERLHHA